MEAHCEADNLDALFIAGGTGVHNAARDERLLPWLCRAYCRSELVLPSAEGQFLLEAAGFAHRSGSGRDDEPMPYASRRGGVNPKASLDVSSPLQTALSVIQDDLGAEIAREIAECVAPPVSTQFTATLRRTASRAVSEKIRDSARWLEANSGQPLAIDEPRNLPP